MSVINVAAMATSRADPAKVFGLLKDPVTWPRWSLFKSGELQRPGRGDRLGLGAVRVFRTPTTCATEEVVEFIPDRRLSYVLLSGMPFRDYRADVDLAPLPDGHLDPLAVFVPREISGHRLVLADGHEPRPQGHRRKAGRRRRGSCHRGRGSS